MKGIMDKPIFARPIIMIDLLFLKLMKIPEIFDFM